ncbi:hypothetical protein DITRI_Ditri10aG0034200 [Diplodiscus trichospermus]
MATANTYPYPATLNVANFVSLRLNHNNYLLWRTQMLAFIESQDMIGFLNGEYPMPQSHLTTSKGTASDVSKDTLLPTSNPDFTSWRKSDRLLRGWITSTLSEGVLCLVVGLESSYDVWKVLEDMFAQNSQEREFHFMQQLSMIRKGNESLNEYILRFKNLCDDLIAIGKNVPDKTKVYCLLNGLGSSYETFVTSMLKPPVPSYQEIVPLLQSHESRNQLHGSEGYKPTQMAFLGHKTYNGQTKNRGIRFNKFNSKGKGLIQGNGYNSNRSGSGAQFYAGNRHNDQPRLPKDKAESSFQDKAPMTDTTKEGPVICQICGKNNHTALKCFNRFNHSYQANDVPKALAALAITEKMKQNGSLTLALLQK